MIACDIDLRSVYCWCSECGEVCNDHDSMGKVFKHAAKHYWEDKTPFQVPIVLCEVAGAKDYTDDKAVAYNKRRWTIFNVAMVATLDSWFKETEAPTVELFVAPSSVWTHGHELKTRHALAKCDARNKDLRECQAMIWSYGKCPTDWVTFADYLANL